MRFHNLNIEAFGKFGKGFQIDNLNNRINVIYGKNEAGKTTLFNVFLTLMFGFSPSNREQHPYVNDGMNGIKVSGAIGKETIERQLLSKPSGKLYEGSLITEINNKALEKTAFISRTMFEEIYALTPEELLNFKENTWTEIEEVVIKNYSAERYVSPRKVIEKLDEEMKGIWKDTRRGKCIIHELEGQRKECIQQKREAVQRDKESKTIEGEIGKLDSQIKLLKGKKAAMQADIFNYNRYFVYLKKLKAMETIAEGISDFEDGSRNDIAQINLSSKLLSENNEEVMTEKEANIKALKLKKQVVTENEEALLRNEKSISALEIKNRALKINKEECDRLRIEQDALERKLKFQLKENFHQEPEIQLMTAVKELDIPKLRALVRKIAERHVQGMYPVSMKEIVLSLCMCVGAAILMAMGFGEEPVIGQASVVLMTLGVAGLSRQLYYHLRNKGGHGIKAASANFEQQCQSLFDNRIALMDAENLDEAFLGRMTELKRLAIDYFELSGRIKENEDKIAAQENMMRISAMRFATEGTSDVSGTIEALMESLGVAKEKAIFNKNYDIEISAYEKDLEELKAEKNAREELYRTLGSGNMELGFEALSRYIQRKEELRRLKDELERDESYLFSKVAIGALSDEEKTIIINTDAMELNTEIEELEKRAQVMDERLLGLKNQQRKILTGKTVEIINSEIHSINSSIEGYKEKWNQLRIMKEMIVVSEKSFKEKNQPELFKKAQEYLAIMTDGKYDRIAIKEVDGRKNVVLGEEISYNLSKGTMQQLYFALRLSLIDLLEKDNCKLPLFLDELLVNWDSSRLQSTIELLNEISKSRQIFIFTCQEALIKDFAEHKTVNIINLG